jgi:[acyl-carrier-protein] S-malonyltransferase
MVEKAGYIFPGQGAQYVGMGRDLYETWPQARDVFDEANDALGFDIKSMCFEGPDMELQKTENSQPAILTVSVAALKVVASMAGSAFPVASASCGLSLGEYSALIAAGSLRFYDGVRLVRKRGIFMEEAARQNPGKMLSIMGLSRGQVEDICSCCGAYVANINCPGQIVIAGTDEAISEAEFLARTMGGRKTVLLDVSGPFHTPLMEPAVEKLRTELDNVSLLPPKFPVLSNVTGDSISSPEQIKESLVGQVSNPVLWEDCIRRLTEMGIETFVEIGPGKVLKGLLKRIDPSLNVMNAGTVEDLAQEAAPAGSVHLTHSPGY